MKFISKLEMRELACNNEKVSRIGSQILVLTKNDIEDFLRGIYLENPPLSEVMPLVLALKSTELIEEVLKIAISKNCISLTFPQIWSKVSDDGIYSIKTWCYIQETT